MRELVPLVPRSTFAKVPGHVVRPTSVCACPGGMVASEVNPMYAIAAGTPYGPSPLNTGDLVALVAILAVFVLFGVAMRVRRVRHES